MGMIVKPVKFEGYKKLTDQQIENVLGEAGEQLVRDIVERTKRGRTVDGGAMKKYSPAYAAKKAAWSRGWGGMKKKKKTKTGRASKYGSRVNSLLAGGVHTTPDLSLTGQMLRSITSKVRKVAKGYNLEIYFTNAEAAKKALKNQQTRRFFGFSKNNKRFLQMKITQALRRITNG